MRAVSPRNLARCTLLVAAVLALAACEARLTLDVAVDEDGSGTLTVALAADEELLAESAAAGVDPLGDLAAAGHALADDGWMVVDETDPDGGRTVGLAVAFRDPEHFTDLAADLAAALSAPEVRLVEHLALRREESLLRLSGAASAEPGPAVADFGLAPAEAVALVEQHDAFSFEVTATLPGELVETSAPAAEMPLRWVVDPGARVEILAVAEQPPDPWWPYAGLAAGAVVALLVLGLVARRRARRRWRRVWAAR